MTLIEITLIIIIFFLLLRIFIYDTNKRRILKSMLEDLWILQEVQNKCSKTADFTKTYNNREGQLFQIKKIKNQLEKL